MLEGKLEDDELLRVSGSEQVAYTAPEPGVKEVAPL
jgi:hypothetical protein